jgi:hypothetical protein
MERRVGQVKTRAKVLAARLEGLLPDLGVGFAPGDLGYAVLDDRFADQAKGAERQQRQAERFGCALEVGHLQGDY